MTDPRLFSAVLYAMLGEKQAKAAARIEADKYGTVRGHIVGWDNGVDPNKRQPRNAQCVCNSGKKAKKCCTTYSVAFDKIQAAKAEAENVGEE